MKLFVKSRDLKLGNVTSRDPSKFTEELNLSTPFKWTSPERTADTPRHAFRVACLESRTRTAFDRKKIELCQVIVATTGILYAFQFRERKKERKRRWLRVSRRKTRPGSQQRLSLSLSVLPRSYYSFFLVPPFSLPLLSLYTFHSIFCTSFPSSLLPIVFESASHGNGRS